MVFPVFSDSIFLPCRYASVAAGVFSLLVCGWVSRYDVASARVGPDACRRLEDGFTRLCKRPKGVVPMDSATFQEEVLTPFFDMVRPCAAAPATAAVTAACLSASHPLPLFLRSRPGVCCSEMSLVSVSRPCSLALYPRAGVAALFPHHGSQNYS